MPSERQQLLRKQEELHKETVERIRDWNKKIAPLAFQPLPESEEITHNMLEMLADGLLFYPGNIEIRGTLMSEFPEEYRIQLARRINTEGLAYFKGWFNKHISGEGNPETIQRIVNRNTDHFIEFWTQRHRGGFPEPDWHKLEESHAKILSGVNNGIYPLYVRMFDGLQVSAFEVFLEDMVPPDVLNGNTGFSKN